VNKRYGVVDMKNVIHRTINPQIRREACRVRTLNTGDVMGMPRSCVIWAHTHDPSALSQAKEADESERGHGRKARKR
jgi:hypothetical protein